MTTAQDLFDQTFTNASDLQAAVETALTGLEAIATGHALTWFDFSATPSMTLAAPGTVKLGTIPGMSHVATAATVPKLKTVSMGTLPNAPNIGELPGLHLPSMADAPILNYTPEGFKDLEIAVMGIIRSGGADISPEIQATIFNQGIERDIQTQVQALDLAGARTGSKGFRIPNGQTGGLQGSVINTFAFRKSDQSREITRTMGELVQRNMAAAISAGISINEALASVSMKTYQVMLEGQRLVFDRFKVESDVAITVFDSGVKALLSEFDAQKTEFDAALRTILAKLELDKTNASLEYDYLGALRQQLSLENQVNISTFEAGLKSKLAQLDADKAVQELMVQYQAQQIKQWEVNVNALVEKGKAQISQAEESNKIALGAIDGIVKAYTGIANSIGSQGLAVIKS